MNPVHNIFVLLIIFSSVLISSPHENRHYIKGESLYNKGKYSRSITHLRRALRDSHIEKDSLLTTKVLYLYGMSLYHQKKFYQSFKKFNEAKNYAIDTALYKEINLRCDRIRVNFFSNKFSPDPEMVRQANYYDLRGENKFKSGDYKKAAQYFQKALSVIKKSYPDGHPIFITKFNNLGKTYFLNGNIDKAIIQFQHGIDNHSLYKYSEPLQLGRLYQNYSDALYTQGNLDLALRYGKLALANYSKHLKKNHPWIQEIKTKLKI